MLNSQIREKRVVLVTWKGGGNFGTCLQSYALYRKLQDLGYSVRFLTGIPQKYSFRLYIKWILSTFGINHIKKRPKKTLQQIKRERFQQGCFNDIVIYSRYQECRLIRITDCFISGSDQIWNTYYHFDPFYFLSFAGEAKRIAYASSIGTKSINEEYLDEVRNLLYKFKHIGMREENAVKVLSELTGRSDICQVLDPTFLLEPKDWYDMSKDAVIEIDIPDSYILCYLIGNNGNYIGQLKDVKNKTGIDNVIIIPSTENPDFNFPHSIVYHDASPIEFVYLLQHATFVCTDSFHATALSINHSKCFVEFLRFNDIDEESQNSRIYDILTHYRLMECIYRDNSDIWSRKIDYNAVQELLSSDRESSLHYLTNAIEN